MTRRRAVRADPSACPIALLAIDEAHCIGECGHTFRPEYLKLARVAERLHLPRVLALTSIATPDVARDVVRVFHIADEDVTVAGFQRPDLELHATTCRAADRPRVLLERIRARRPGPGIVIRDASAHRRGGLRLPHRWGRGRPSDRSVRRSEPCSGDSVPKGTLRWRQRGHSLDSSPGSPHPPSVALD